MTSFGERVRELMAEQGVSLRELSRRTFYDVGHLSRVLNGRKPASSELAQRIDDALTANGALASLKTPAPDHEVELMELTRLAELSGIGSETLSELEVATDRLCREYSTQDPASLRRRTTAHLRCVLGLLDGRTTLAQHRELLVHAGWLAVLLGCVAYDVGDRAAAGQARRLAHRLGDQAGHGQIVAWAYELGAWYALVEGRYPEVVELSERGLQHAGESSAAVQLTLQGAHGHARMGDVQARAMLEAGRMILEHLPRPEHPEHHFVFDPDKHTFYVAKILTALGKDDLAAEEHARDVMWHCEQTNSWPMRLTESQINLGLIAGRRGDLDEAVGLGSSALRPERRSAGLVPHAEELLQALTDRYPAEQLTQEYRELLAANRAR